MPLQRVTKLKDEMFYSAYIWAVWAKALIFNRKRYKELKSKFTENQGYSLLPFEKTKSIFVHIPKCAGVSVNQALYGSLAGGHLSIQDYIIAFGPIKFRSFYKFTIVRNPWDRLVSAFHFLKGGGFNSKDKIWFETHIGKNISFEEFVLTKLNKPEVLDWYHFRPQHTFISDNKNVSLVDFIGKLENLDTDFGRIAEKLGVHLNVSKSNESLRSSYKFYYSEKSRLVVSEIYKKDIELFNYTFD